MTAKSTLACLATAVALGAASSQSAFAQSSDDTAVTVSYADLNLATDRDAKTLLHRIHTAAVLGCDASPVMPLSLKRVYDQCVADRVDHAVAMVNSPLLTALNNGQAPTTVLASAQ